MKKKPESYAGYFRPHIGKVLGAFFLSALSSAIAFISTNVLSQFVDQISIAKSFCPLAILIIIWLICGLSSKLTSFAASRILLAVQAKVQHKIKWRLLGKLANASIESVGKSNPTDLSEKTSEDVNRFLDSIHTIYQEVFSVLLGIAALAYSAYVSWQIFVIFVISLFSILVVHFNMKKEMAASQTNARKASVFAKHFITQILKAFCDIQVQSLTVGIKNHINSILEDEVSANTKANKVFINSGLISSILSLLSQVAFLLLGALLVVNSRLTVANFIALYLYRSYVFGLADSSLRIIKSKAQMDAAKDRMDDIFRRKSVKKEVWGYSHLPNPTGNITVRNLCATRGDKTVLDDLSLELPSGKFIGIVGESGCGKSSLLAVLSKGLSYTGDILLDGIQLSDLSEESHRRAITLAPQDAFIFQELTFRENLCLANPNASDDEIWRCLKRCGADAFIHAKGGLDSPSKGLSGGQRQKLALARLHLRGGKIILLDESTSALDGEAQSTIIQTVRQAANMGHTIILVAHRVSTLKNADKILLMDKGRIIAQGTYSELYETSEKFRRLADLG